MDKIIAENLAPDQEWRGTDARKGSITYYIHSIKDGRVIHTYTSKRGCAIGASLTIDEFVDMLNRQNAVLVKMNKQNDVSVKTSRSSPFQHRGRNGTILEATSIDLAKGKNVLKRPQKLTDAKFAEDLTEIIAFWTLHIYPSLVEDCKGFSGFDCIKYEIVSH